MPENRLPGLHCVVCVKVTPKPEEVHVDPGTRLLQRSGVRSEINPPDMNALEMALKLKDLHGGTVSILSMGPPYYEPVLRVGLAMGCNHLYLLSDREFSGADTLATTYTLAQGIRQIEALSDGPADLVLCGEESSDGATGQVPAGLAEWLDRPQMTLLSGIEIDLDRRSVRGWRSLPGGYEVLETSLPCLVSVRSACNEPRFMDYRLKSRAFNPPNVDVPPLVTVWGASELQADPDWIGVTGSPTQVSGLAEASLRERRRIRLQGEPGAIARQLLAVLEETGVK